MFFRWLNRLFTGGKKVETEIRQIKKRVDEKVDQLKEKAKKGDSDATLKLQGLRETVTEQSIRYCKGNKAAPALVLISVLALGAGGCSPQNRVEEEDRQGIHVALQIDEIQDAELDRLEEAVADNPDIREKFGKIVMNMRLENDDRKAIHRQLLANFGHPKEPVQYDPAKMPDLLTRMKKAHSVTFWGMIGAGILSVGGIVLGIARSPLAKFLPGFGNVFGAVDGVITGVEKWMAQKKESGQAFEAKDLATMISEVVGSDPHLAKLVDKRLAKVKAKLGIEPGEEEEPEPPADPPTAPPPPPPAIVTPAAATAPASSA